jgi:hypothetical protein
MRKGKGQEWLMTAVAPAKEKLQEAIERLRDDIDRVEFWADALDRLTQPIPDYQPNDDLSRRLLPNVKRSTVLSDRH